MVLIFSRHNETSTDLVIDWLIHYNIPFKRINEDYFYNVNWDFENDINYIGGVNINEIKVVWFRKFTTRMYNEISSLIPKFFNIGTFKFLNDEFKSYHDYIIFKLLLNKNIKWITSLEKLTENKLIQIEYAKKVGLDIPKSFIVSNKKDLMNIISKGEFITKAITNARHLPLEGDNMVMMQTSLINDKIDMIPEIFPPSLIQERIKKEFEVRVVFIDDKIYSTKIIESGEEDIDHRFNLFSLDSRYEIITLEKKLELKLKKLMNFMNLNFASIDLIKGIDNIYYFLEVNPTGQFGYHTFPNNIYMEKIIAEYIKKVYNNE